MRAPKSDIEIARLAKLKPIAKVAACIGIPARALYAYGPYMAKLTPEYLADVQKKSSRGKLILVTAISPTPAGEGKTTTSIGLGDALTQLGKKTMLCLREPSLGPCFGMKGGATGGGHAQIMPMDEINLHFTGDLHAITTANNLLAAMLDNHIYWGNELGLDLSKISWHRALDMNDRALRRADLDLGHDQSRRDHFDITTASEVMAIFCLANSLADLEERLGKIIVARTTDGKAVTAKDLKASPSMTVLLKNAFCPNLVQTLGHTPALVHGGPFANIAHGCNSVLATTSALKLADYVVTEAGFGADLGAEKFFDIKCRTAGLSPAAAVVVATVRALKMHGGVEKSNLAAPDAAAVERGLPNLLRHLENVKKFGVPAMVAINHFTTDTAEEVDVIRAACAKLGVQAVVCKHWAEGGAGAMDLAREVVQLVKTTPSNFKPLYQTTGTLADKIQTIAREIYRAEKVEFAPEALAKLDEFTKAGFGDLPVCMAKTQYSFTTDPKAMGAPTGFTLPVRDVRLSAGAVFVVALCGDIITMPGLPREPAAHRIYLNAQGEIEGLS